MSTKGRIYRCDICDMAEERQRIPTPAIGSDDDSARCVGWRIGATQAKQRNVICPECSGIDEDYWDRKVLSVAAMSGMYGTLAGHPDDQNPRRKDETS